MRHRIWRWLADTVPDILEAVWRGDPQKLAIMAAIVILVLLGVLLHWLWGLLRAKYPNQLPEGSPVEDDWKPPSSEEMDRVINAKRS